MILVFSSVLVVAYTIYFCIHATSRKNYVSAVTGKCISMSLGMVAILEATSGKVKETPAQHDHGG